MYPLTSSADALGHDGFLGIRPVGSFLKGSEPKSSFTQIGECLDKLSPLCITPESNTREREREREREERKLVKTMAKLRMVHASTHGARKPPGPKCFVVITE